MYVLARNDSIENLSELNGGNVTDGKYRVYSIAVHILYNIIYDPGHGKLGDSRRLPAKRKDPGIYRYHCGIYGRTYSESSSPKLSGKSDEVLNQLVQSR